MSVPNFKKDFEGKYKERHTIKDKHIKRSENSGYCILEIAIGG